MEETNKILAKIDFLRIVFARIITLLPKFDIADKTVLPYGLKPHTRSVSWIVEQVIVQQAKFRKDELGLDEVSFDMPDTCLHDCVISKSGQKYFVNVKIHNIGGKENKNDISAVEKLYFQYSANPDYDLVFACVGVSFKENSIFFDPNYLEIFSAQFLPIYVNPRNDKIQAKYNHKMEIRSRKDFLKLLKKNSKSIILK
ncbi:MAG TPA: hypothetical protein PLA19_04590 [Candidatus Pacearchaeota archaeon]|jgi:hypothetical protein|nr:hypothetical protein [Candidatus Pacearchaeota archaeon]